MHAQHFAEAWNVQIRILCYLYKLARVRLVIKISVINFLFHMLRLWRRIVRLLRTQKKNLINPDSHQIYGNS